MCEATMESRDTPGHTHTCVMLNHPGDHKCSAPACRRWFALAR